MAIELLDIFATVLWYLKIRGNQNTPELLKKLKLVVNAVGMVNSKKWRRDLHLWDPDNNDAFKALLNSDLFVSIIAANPELAEIVDIVREKMDNPSSEFDDYDESSSDMNTLASDLQTGFLIDKKVTSPRRTLDNSAADDSLQTPDPLSNTSLTAGSGSGSGSKSAAAQNKVARTLVF